MAEPLGTEAWTTPDDERMGDSLMRGRGYVV